jgi:hypothetical protein
MSYETVYAGSWFPKLLMAFVAVSAVKARKRRDILAYIRRSELPDAPP